MTDPEEQSDQASMLAGIVAGVGVAIALVRFGLVSSFILQMVWYDFDFFHSFVS